MDDVCIGRNGRRVRRREEARKGNIIKQKRSGGKEGRGLAAVCLIARSFPSSLARSFVRSFIHSLAWSVG
jgi:hypothetical protein